MKFDELLIGEYFTLPNSYGIYQKIDPDLNDGYLDVEIIPNTGIQSRLLKPNDEVISVRRDTDKYE